MHLTFAGEAGLKRFVEMLADKELFKPRCWSWGEAPDDTEASQIHSAYRHVMEDVPGRSLSGVCR